MQRSVEGVIRGWEFPRSQASMGHPIPDVPIWSSLSDPERWCICSGRKRLMRIRAGKICCVVPLRSGVCNGMGRWAEFCCEECSVPIWCGRMLRVRVWMDKGGASESGGPRGRECLADGRLIGMRNIDMVMAAVLRVMLGKIVEAGPLRQRAPAGTGRGGKLMRKGWTTGPSFFSPEGPCCGFGR
jgi:hypothetical protein